MTGPAAWAVSQTAADKVRDCGPPPEDPHALVVIGFYLIIMLIIVLIVSGTSWLWKHGWGP